MDDDAPAKPAPPAPAAPRCPVCGEPFVRATLVLCRDCSAPHHRRCWGFNKGCSTYACKCRAFVLPPTGAGERVEFSVQGDFPASVHLGWTGAFTAVTVALTGLCAAAVGLSEQLAGAAVALYFSSVWVVPLLIAVTHKHYLLDPEEAAIHRELRLGSTVLQRLPSWRTFSEVEELEVRTTKGQGQQGEVKLLEVWLRDATGERHRLDRSLWSDKDEVLANADAAADLLDTTLSLPRTIAGARELPAGLSRAIAALPRDLPEETALLEASQDGDPGPGESGGTSG